MINAMINNSIVITNPAILILLFIKFLLDRHWLKIDAYYYSPIVIMDFYWRWQFRGSGALSTPGYLRLFRYGSSSFRISS